LLCCGVLRAETIVETSTSAIWSNQTGSAESTGISDWGGHNTVGAFSLAGDGEGGTNKNNDGNAFREQDLNTLDGVAGATLIFNEVATLPAAPQSSGTVFRFH